MNKVVKHSFEFKFNAGFDVDITPEKAEEIKDDESLINEIIESALMDIDTKEAFFEREGEYPEVLGIEEGNPYIHTRIYGYYVAESVGESYDDCKSKAKMIYESADLGQFTMGDDFYNEGITYDEEIKPDCEALIELIEEYIEEHKKSCKGVSDAIDIDAYAAINLDDCGYTIGVIVADLENPTVRVTLFANAGTFPNTIQPIVYKVDVVSKVYLRSDCNLGTADLSLAEFKDTVRDLSCGGSIDKLLDRLSLDVPSKSTQEYER